MLFYLIPSFCWFLYGLYSDSQIKTPSIVLSILFFSPLILISALRGNVGTDTWTYLFEIEQIILQNERIFAGFEPGYELFLQLLSTVVSDPRTTVIILTIANSILFFIATRLWGGSVAVTAAVLVPCFYFDFTMNGLRIGTAFPLAMLACIALKNKQTMMFVFLSVLAMSFQMTVAVLIGLLLIQQEHIWITLKKVSLLGIVKIIVILITLLALPYYFLSDRILLKLIYYAAETSPSDVSGIGPLIISVLLFALSFIHSGLKQNRLMLVYLIIQIAFYQITKISYAGTRLQMIALLAQALYFKFPINIYYKHIRILSLCGLFAICIAWRLRGFSQEIEGDSPFLPYHFMWQVTLNFINKLNLYHYIG